SHLPSCDFPEHSAAIATLRHFWDPDWKFSEVFTLALGQTQYLLYYVAGAVLAVPFGSAERANLVLLSAIAVSLPYALRALLQATKRDERLALFACPLFFNESLMIGFLNYMATLPLVLDGLALVVRQCEAPTRRRAI